MTATVIQMRDPAEHPVWVKALEILAREDPRLDGVFNGAVVSQAGGPLNVDNWKIYVTDPQALALPPPVVCAMLRKALVHAAPKYYAEKSVDPFWPSVLVMYPPPIVDPRAVADPGPLLEESVAKDPSVAGSSLLEPRRPVVHLDPGTLEEDRLNETRLRSLRQIREALKVSVTLLDEEIERLKDE